MPDRGQNPLPGTLFFVGLEENRAKARANDQRGLAKGPDKRAKNFFVSQFLNFLLAFVYTGNLAGVFSAPCKACALDLSCKEKGPLVRIFRPIPFKPGPETHFRAAKAFPRLGDGLQLFFGGMRRRFSNLLRK